MAAPRPGPRARARHAVLALVLSLGMTPVLSPGAAFAARKGSEAPADAPLRLDALLDSLRTARGVPGLAAAVVDHGRLVAIGAAGVPWVGAPRSLTVDDPLHIGSCTKSITALAIARLVERGSIQWNETLADVFPDVMPQMLPVYRHVRLDQLLTHRAAIPAYESIEDDTLASMNSVERDPIATRVAFVRRVLQEAPQHDPASRYDYSNAGYTLAAAMVERKTGKAWDRLVTELVFEPLGMRSAGFGWPASPHHADRPRGHRCDDSTGAAPEPLDSSYRLGAVMGPGGDVHASIADLARYVAFHLDGEEGRATKPALASQTWRRLHDDPDGQSSGYAMGWQVLPVDSARSMLFHDGSAGTFYTRILIQPTLDRAVVIATNAGPPCGRAACEQGVTAVLARVKRAN